MGLVARTELRPTRIITAHSYKTMCKTCDGCVAMGPVFRCQRLPGNRDGYLCSEPKSGRAMNPKIRDKKLFADV